MVGLPLTNSALLPCLPVDMAALAAHALEEEIWLTPKPGLVDSENSGSHQDMDLPLFLASIAAIRPWLSQFVILGQQHAFHPASSQLVSLRPAGIACEQAMFTATAGVNTHKGGIFALGLLCSASGRLQGRGDRLTQSALCQEVSAICQGLVARELRSSQRRATVGEKLFAQYGLTGARGEAESGFATVRRHVLPHWFDECEPRRRLLAALLRLMAHNPDTNLVSRGGLAGLKFVQKYALRLLTDGWDIDALREMDWQLIRRHLSPGGSADLLAIAAILAVFPV